MFSRSSIVGVNGFVHDDFGGGTDEVFGDDAVKDDEDDERKCVEDDDDGDEEGDLPEGDGLREALRVLSSIFSDGVVLGNGQDRAAMKEIRTCMRYLQKMQQKVLDKENVGKDKTSDGRTQNLNMYLLIL